MKKLFLNFILITAVVFSLSSCGPTGVYVSSRPEPPYYSRPISPNPSYVWIDGEWVWGGRQYVYRNGYWAPPRGHRVWVGGGWEQRREGWHWRQGHWR